MDTAAVAKNGAPYPSLTAQLGLTSSKDVDVPVCCIFLVLYIIGAVGHMTIFQRNRRRQHKFILSAMTFGFCMMRTLTCSLRIGWAYKPNNVSLGIAAVIFANAGVFLMFVLDLLMAQRCLRAAYPKLGWSRILHYAFLIHYCGVPCVLVMVICATVYTHYTLSISSLNACRDALLVGGTYVTIFSFLPLVIAVTLAILGKGKNSEDFGAGSWSAKLWIIGFTSLLLCLGQTFRTAVNYMPARPANDPYSFQGKACFYVFYFTVEIIVVYTFLLSRFDKRFWVPNGAKGTYAGVSEASPSVSEDETEVKHETV